MEAANGFHEVAYGEDSITAELSKMIIEEFGEDSSVYPVFNGTGANVIALSSLCQRWEAVICAASAHVACDEGGAPEKVAGIKLHAVSTPDGKLTPGLISSQLFDRGSVHRSQPAAVTITNTTELGTVYTSEEVRAIAETTHAAGLLLHMDGARIFNAAAALQLPLRAFTSDVGVDILSLGATKIGAMGAEAIVVFPRGAAAPCLAASLPFLRKSAMQLASKQRFISAQLCAVLRDGLGVALAQGANAAAAALEEGLRELPNVSLPQPRQANAVFPVISPELAAVLGSCVRFYEWDVNTYAPAGVMVRWMTSWDTTLGSVQHFLGLVRAESLKLGEIRMVDGRAARP